jgi:hypothetical protein
MGFNIVLPEARTMYSVLKNNLLSRKISYMFRPNVVIGLTTRKERKCSQLLEFDITKRHLYIKINNLDKQPWE